MDSVGFWSEGYLKGVSDGVQNVFNVEHVQYAAVLRQSFYSECYMVGFPQFYFTDECSSEGYFEGYVQGVVQSCSESLIVNVAECFEDAAGEVFNMWADEENMNYADRLTMKHEMTGFIDVNVREICDCPWVEL